MFDVIDALFAAAGLAGASFGVYGMRRAARTAPVVNDSPSLETPGVAVITVVDRALVNHNREFLSLFGWNEADDMRGKSTRIIYADDDEYIRVGKIAYPIINEGGTFSGECWLARADGTRFWGRLTGRVVEGEVMGQGDAPTYSIWTISDLSDRKRIDVAVNEALARLTTILDSINATVYVTDMQTYEILFMNRYGKGLYGDAVGRTCWHAIAGDEAVGPCAHCTNDHLVLGGEPVVWEERGVRDGHWYQHRDSAIEWIDGSTVRLSVATDITERKTMEEELRELNRNLEDRVAAEVEKRRVQEQLLVQQSKMAAMGEMIGAIAHQWRQPLNALGLVVQDLVDAYDYEEMSREYLVDAVKQGMAFIDFMSHTIDDFRSFFRTSKFAVDFDVAAALKETVSLVSGQFANKTIQLSIDIEGAPPVIHNYANEFKQVVLNILTNARDAIVNRREGPGPHDLQGKVMITVRTGDDFVDVDIADNGGGIPDDVMPNIFHAYYTTKKETDGTGIGLYMSRVIVEKNMGGRIGVENGPEGAVFSIRLPKRLSESP